MNINLEELINLFKEGEKSNQLIFIDLLNDLLFYDIEKKKQPIQTFDFMYFEKNYKDKIIKNLYDFAIRELGKENLDKRLNNFWKIFCEETFGVLDFSNYTTFSLIPTKKIKNFSKDLDLLIKNKELNINNIFRIRKILLKFFSENGLIVLEKNEGKLKLKELYEVCEKNPDKDPFFKLMNQILREDKEIFGEKEYNKSIEKLDEIDDNIDKCIFNKKYVEKLLSKITGKIEFSFNPIERKIFYMGEEIHQFKDINNKNYNFFKLMFSYEKGIEINPKKMYIFYNNDEYYTDLNNQSINNKLIKLKGKCNDFIRDKIKNKEIKLFSQEKRDNNLYFIRNF